MLQDSGARREFETGAVRDVAEGKGRCDLLPLDIIAARLNDDVLASINKYLDYGNTNILWIAFFHFARNRYDVLTEELLIPHALLEVSKQFEEGASKYGERNWQKGIPLHCYIDSAVRHYLKFLRRDNDEPHDRAFMWNILCAIWTHTNKPELIDLPFAKSKEARSCG